MKYIWRFLIFTGEKSGRAGVFILSLLIKIYKKLISPFLPQACRYYPTCSAYALESLKKHGVLKGSYLTVKRLLRCSPFFPGGPDPVPDKFHF